MNFKLKQLRSPADQKFVLHAANTRVSTTLATSTTEFEILTLDQLELIWEKFDLIRHVMSYVAVSRRLKLLQEVDFDDHAILRDSVNLFAKSMHTDDEGRVRVLK